jgi:hypothetical protein
MRKNPCRRPDHRPVKVHRSYLIEEAAAVLNVHKNTVRAWIRTGLPLVDHKRGDLGTMAISKTQAAGAVPFAATRPTPAAAVGGSVKSLRLSSTGTFTRRCGPTVMNRSEQRGHG